MEITSKFVFRGLKLISQPFAHTNFKNCFKKAASVSELIKFAASIKWILKCTEVITTES